MRLEGSHKGSRHPLSLGAYGGERRVMSMSIPLQGYPRSAAVTPRLQVAESTGSTNADVVTAAAASPEQWPHLSRRC